METPNIMETPEEGSPYAIYRNSNDRCEITDLYGEAPTKQIVSEN